MHVTKVASLIVASSQRRSAICSCQCAFCSLLLRRRRLRSCACQRLRACHRRRACRRRRRWSRRLSACAALVSATALATLAAFASSMAIPAALAATALRCRCRRCCRLCDFALALAPLARGIPLIKLAASRPCRCRSGCRAVARRHVPLGMPSRCPASTHPGMCVDCPLPPLP